MSQVFDTWLGLATLGVVLYFVFSNAGDTIAIIHESSAVGGGFINNLEGGSNVYSGYVPNRSKSLPKRA